MVHVEKFVSAWYIHVPALLCMVYYEGIPINNNIIMYSSVTVTNCLCIVECYCIMVSCHTGVQLISMAFVIMVQMPTGCSGRVDSPIA